MVSKSIGSSRPHLRQLRFLAFGLLAITLLSQTNIASGQKLFVLSDPFEHAQSESVASELTTGKSAQEQSVLDELQTQSSPSEIRLDEPPPKDPSIENIGEAIDSLLDGDENGIEYQVGRFVPQMPSIDLLNTTPKLGTPPDDRETLSQAQTIQRFTSTKVVGVTTDEVRYRSLLFEEPQLERYGLTETPRTQPARSAAKFFVRGVFFPLAYLKNRHRGEESNKNWPQ